MTLFVRKAIYMLAAAAVVASCGPSPESEPAEPPAQSQLSETEQRIQGLLAVNTALQNYHATHGSYPIANGAQGYATNWGSALGERWIPELTELTPFPRDPALSEAGDGPQFLYFSDGTNYKLIAHATGDCAPEVETQGVQIDPNRRNEETCWGYGFWSAGGAAL
jgi:hypothetical protein